MPVQSRRDFLRLAAGAIGAGAAAGVLPPVIRRALALPADDATGTIRDVEHIVILMQENRSFDHYFGTLRGVRGFGDPRPVPLPDGRPVWQQPDGTGYRLPFRPRGGALGPVHLEGTPHNWPDSHDAWNGGRGDGWIAAKGRATMTHLAREDIPFHYALADAFTICDAYHCSLMGSTTPNRLHMWTGWVGNDGRLGGPALDNAHRDYAWTTYPERLESAGLSWRIYQDIGTGLDETGAWGWTQDPYIGNYGDNSLLHFAPYRNARPGDALYEKARRGTNVARGDRHLDDLRADVARGSLPQVSWIVAPEAFSEHPNWPANFGAWYVAEVLGILTSDPDVWSRTALFVTYDENDGFFDHVPPPYAPWSDSAGRSSVDTRDEFFAGSGSYAANPYGLGHRVPMVVVSPWTRGGWVCSQTFDHTSLIRFIEARFGDGHPDLVEPQITPWRRAVCGDLTSAFDFADPNRGLPVLPSTEGYAPPDRLRHDAVATRPPDEQAMPEQEPGVRPARALPYAFDVTGRAGDDRYRLDFANTGAAAAAFQVYASRRLDGPWTYTAAAGSQVSDTWSTATDPRGRYALSVFGPNGFLREFAGDVRDAAGGRASPEVASSHDADGGALVLHLANRGDAGCLLTLRANHYADPAPRTVALAAGRTIDVEWPIAAHANWYDLTIESSHDAGWRRRLAGHIENGAPSRSDPAFGSG
ncbi:phospholipase C, phosphocholine-specific [Dokdonella sp.]|uniref:phosphocholine-specific phospholipase C n=1 Tax=Dokdonella sp. TaxID=2291710 RepID=UPI002612233E|nr:phospholipase C, phosphocholine-specific [Dokdonella sp.]